MVVNQVHGELKTHQPTLTPEQVAGFCDIRDILSSFLQEFDVKEVLPMRMLQKMRLLEDKGVLFCKKKLKELPVLNSDGKFTGASTGNSMSLLDLIENVFLVETEKKGTIHRVAMFDKEGGIMQIISQTDIIKLLVTHKEKLGDLASKTLEEVGLAKKQVIEVPPEVSAFQVLEIIQEKGISAVAVVNSIGAIIGNFSVSELRTILAEHFGSLSLPVGEFLALEHGTEYSGYGIYNTQEVEDSQGAKLNTTKTVGVRKQQLVLLVFIQVNNRLCWTRVTKANLVLVQIPRMASDTIHQFPSVSQITRSLLAGGTAGAVSRTAVAPLERLKILMQIQGNKQIYRGTWQGLVHMAQTDGVIGMFKGNGINCIRIFPNAAIKFLFYEEIERGMVTFMKYRGGDGEMNWFLRLVAGGLAGIAGMSATYPLDMVRGRLSIQEGRNQQYRGIVHATSVIVREEGPLALYRGWVPSVIGVFPYMGFNFGVYETLKKRLMKQYGVKRDTDLSTVTRLGCGAIAGAVGQTMAYPFDVVRRRLQVSGWEGASNLHKDSKGQAVVYRGMLDCFRKTIQEEGIQALFKGIWPNYIKVVPSIAIAFVVYEQTKKMLGAEIKMSG
eukprot:TRINITY_DN981_c0_g1_i1.p1 TRINITY_DN981_c0_g1~~TRINITY_DN981_c0_g1_i1.p1  ORF type:complete len:694 (-),score=77.01 TRINITY_DN981_c0_g1_i1:202-2034(-)